MKKIFVTLLATFVLTSCATNEIKRDKVEKPIFKGNPRTEIIIRDVIQKLSKLKVPAPKVNELEFVSIDIKSGNEVSKTTYRIKSSNNSIVNLNSYSASSKKDGLFGVRGRSVLQTTLINSGGFLNYAGQSLRSSKDNLLTTKNHFYKFMLTRISAVKGMLFPLKVGNKASFNKTIISKKGFDDNGISDREHNVAVSFEIIDVFENYSENGNTYPKKTYLIEWKKVNLRSKREKKTHIYYNAEINWVVVRKQYKNGENTKTMVLQKWM